MEVPRCAECNGSGEVVIRGCHHQGNCPCGDDRAFPCPDCDGTGRGGCDHCGEPATHRALYSDQFFCDECDQAEPRGDHPLGGMGFGIDYAPALAEARRLK